MSRQTRSSRQPSHIPPDPEPSAHITEFDAAEELTDTPEQIAAPLAADNYLNNDPPTPPNASAAHQVSPIPSRHQSPPLDPNLHMAEALRLLTQELRRRDNSVPPPTHKRAKAKEPDTFDGTEPKKLNNFILLCNLYFRTNPAYSDDTTKVTFALSYLRGMALEYFEPTLLDSDETPDWLEDWDTFVQTLRTQFGPIDPAGDAESKLDHLKMQDNQRIIKYNVEFNALAIRTGWDDNVLRYRYYTGLAERIKDIMGQQGKPSTLSEMRALAHSIDHRYWERQKEKSRGGKKSDDKPDKGKSDDKGKASTSGSNNNSGSSGNNNNSNNSNSNKNKKDNKSGKAPSTSGTPNPLADKLGKDGKLTPQERQRRFDNNLCLFCGGPGHTTANCTKAAASKAKARAAQAKEKDPPAGDSKKV